jgi:hypothetical protein
MCGWRDFASVFHNELVETLSPHRNKHMTTSEIRELVESNPAFKGREQWVYPSDHCINHTNKGACYCARTDKAIFERIGRGNYRVHESLKNL